MKTLLSEYGEGYCKVCRFIVGLDEKGRLAVHTRGAAVSARWGSTPNPCKGSLRRPAPENRVPYRALKSIFRLTPAKGRCLSCGKTVKLARHYTDDSKYYALRHPWENGLGVCDGTGETVKPQ